MELFEAIHSRRSVRKYLPDPVKPEDLTAILKTALGARGLAGRKVTYA